LPLIKLSEIVCAHKPHERHAWIKFLKSFQCLSREARANLGFYICDIHTWVIHHSTCMPHTAPYRRWPVLFEWISRGHHPPDTVQSKSLQGRFRDVDMAGVRRIKRAAKQANHLT
jgi:hypothetical protein